jgi:hypothetical protein
MSKIVNRLLEVVVLLFTLLIPTVALSQDTHHAVPVELEQRIEIRVELTKEELVKYHAEQMQLDRDFVMNLHKLDAKLFCMAQNNFFEARGESMVGKVAVSEVVVNRVESSKYPKDICAVVKQYTNVKEQDENGMTKVVAKVCQFSWVCRGNGRIPLAPNGGTVDARVYGEWYDSVVAALLVYQGKVRGVVNEATSFYSHKQVKPIWVRRGDHAKVIGNHTFITPKEKK